MKTGNKKIAVTAIMSTIAYILSTLVVFPNMAPFQHCINVICAVILGPWYGFLSALLTGILRMLSGRTILAVIGGVFGAFLAGILYRLTRKMFFAVLGEIIGTGLISALVSMPVMKYGFAQDPSVIDSIFYYIPFFLPASITGAVMGYAVLLVMKRSGALAKIKELLI